MAGSIRTLYEATNERAHFFQTVHAWPLSEEINYDGWLQNFDKGNDKKIACHILNFFTYFPDKMIDQMLKSSIGKAGEKLSRCFTDWKHNDFITRCIYSFIPGETQNPTDSGHIFTRKLRDVLGVPEQRIIDYREIPNVLTRITKPTPVIFVDDFVGSGAQCDKAWNINKLNGMTLKEISDNSDHIFVYAPLIMNEIGYKRIKSKCASLVLSATHVLGSEYNLFNSNCICWNRDLDLYNAGVKLILKKSNELGIPSTRGNLTYDEKGFLEQGLALSFAHGTPDAVPAFFYWCHENWTPLFQKRYKR
jgi:hypothetical protein